MSDLLKARRTYLHACRFISQWAEERGENGQLVSMQIEILIEEGRKNKKLPAAPQNRAMVQASTGKVNPMSDSISNADRLLLEKDGIHVEAAPVTKPGRLTKAMRADFRHAGFRNPTQPVEWTVEAELANGQPGWAPTDAQIKHVSYEVRMGIREQKA